MADGVFNIAKGRVVEFYSRVAGNDPANSALIVVVLAAEGLVPDATLQDYDTLGEILEGASAEATNEGYERKVLTDTDLSAPSPNDTDNRFDVDIPDLTWETVEEEGEAWGKLLVCYDGNTTTGSDTDIVPLTYHDFAVTPDGSSITAQIPTAGFFGAS